ncbi:MAG: energy-coupling factor ABC transporter ATP-binding protein [Gammaproteobacteria bacterium]|nr:energy-coupling factor ABC transporter ATP-binding protein [Gammaproteobacteria bacterium]
MPPPTYLLRGLACGYAADNPVLKGIDLEVGQGSIVAFVGPNGAGKSTLLKTLALELPPIHGEIRCLGQSALGALRRSVGFLPQAPFLFRGTALDNVAVGLRFRGMGRSLRRSLARQCLEGLELGALAEKDARELSGGQAQQVAVARLLVLQPRALLLDELFAPLDREAVSMLEDLIRKIRLHDGQTIVFTTHDLNRALVLADQVWEIRDGRLSAPFPFLVGRSGAGAASV